VKIPRLQAEQVSTWEAGYRGMAGKKLFLDINYYNGVSKNFLSPGLPVGGRILQMGDQPVRSNTPGIVQNDTLKGASFSTYFNYGTVRVWGLDAGLSYSFSKIISLALKYSWFDSDLENDDMKNDANRDTVLSVEEKSLNAPHHRGSAILSFENLLRRNAFFKVAVRYLERYNFYSGNQIGTEDGEGSRGKVPRPPLPPLVKNFNWGPLGGFATVDLSAGMNLNELTSLTINCNNLFNIKQREFVGSPLIGRLISVELKLHLPEKLTGEK
jgi:iron complex outermembrane receptor protein